MGTDIIPLDQAQGAVDSPLPPAERAILTAALKEAKRLVAQQDKTRKKAFPYAKAVCDNERKLGQQLAGMDKRAGARDGKRDNNLKPRLADMGVSPMRSHRAQRMAKVPEGKYEDWLEACQLEDPEGRITLPTLEGLYSLYGPVGDPPVSKNTGEDEWYTPEKYIEAARKTMGSIDLDPATCDKANEMVKAEWFYTLEEDGLIQGWTGNVWLNPPFTMLLPFTEKLVAEYDEGTEVKQAIMIGPNYSDSTWWQNAAEYASSICHTNHRIRFVSSRTGEPTKSSPTNGHTFFYFGKRLQAFTKHFEQFGVIR